MFWHYTDADPIPPSITLVITPVIDRCQVLRPPLPSPQPPRGPKAAAAADKAAAVLKKEVSNGLSAPSIRIQDGCRGPAVVSIVLNVLLLLSLDDYYSL